MLLLSDHFVPGILTPFLRCVKGSLHHEVVYKFKAQSHEKFKGARATSSLCQRTAETRKLSGYFQFHHHLMKFTPLPSLALAINSEVFCISRSTN